MVTQSADLILDFRLSTASDRGHTNNRPCGLMARCLLLLQGAARLKSKKRGSPGAR
jgi:hypothetical protein